MSDGYITGDAVAWVLKSGGKTCGVSAVHRVYHSGKTYCNRALPKEEFRFPPLKSLNVCRRCQALCARAESHLQQQRETA